MSDDRQTFAELVEAMMGGSEEAAWQLTKVYSPHILNVVRASLPRVIRSKVDSQDLLQSIWASLLLMPEGLPRFAGPDDFLGYVAAVAKYKVVDKHRHYSSRKRNVYAERGVAETALADNDASRSDRPPKGSLYTNDPFPSQALLVEDCWRQVVESSNERDQAIVTMRARGETYESIAETLCISERTARRTVDRIIKQFFCK